MNNNKYNLSAYKMTVFQEAARLLREKYFPDDGQAPPLICDVIFRAPREVPTEVIQQVIIALHRAEKSEEEMMSRFRLEEMRDEEIKNLAEVQEAAKEVSPKVAPGRGQTRTVGKVAHRTR
jgi:hypothetical protein